MRLRRPVELLQGPRRGLRPGARRGVREAHGLVREDAAPLFRRRRQDPVRAFQRRHVRVIKLNEGQTVSSIAIVPHQEDAPEEDEEENNVDATNNALHHVDELLQSTEEDLENDDEGTEEDA